MDKIKFIDLFAGMGGLRLGFEQAISDLGKQSECVMTSEIKTHALKVLVDNHHQDNIVGDITKVDSVDIPNFDYLLGGFPCQTFSTAGNRLGFADTRGTLFFEIERILKDKKPKGFILENVEGLIRHDMEKDSLDSKGRTFKVILKKLTDLGYYVDWQLLNAKDFGIPQNRKRVFIIGHLEHPVSLSNFEKKKAILEDILEQNISTEKNEFSAKLFEYFKEEELYGKQIKDKRGGKNNIHSWDFDLKGPTTREQKNILSTLLKERRKKKWADIIGITWMDGMPLTTKQIHSFLPEYNLDFLEESLSDLVDKKYVSFEHPKDLVKTNSGSRREYRTDLDKGYNIVTGKLSFQFHSILNPKGIAATVVATDAANIGVVDNETIRSLTPIEGKRLFGYPDDFKINLSDTLAYDLLGNTVVVPVVREVAKKLFIESEAEIKVPAEQLTLNLG